MGEKFAAHRIAVEFCWHMKHKSVIGFMSPNSSAFTGCLILDPYKLRRQGKNFIFVVQDGIGLGVGTNSSW